MFLSHLPISLHELFWGKGHPDRSFRHNSGEVFWRLGPDVVVAFVGKKIGPVDPYDMIHEMIDGTFGWTIIGKIVCCRL